MSRPAALLLLALGACGGSSAGVLPTQADALDPRRFFPLETGTIWSYTVRDGSGMPTLATVRVLSVDSSGARVQRNRQEPEVFVATAEGVRRRGADTWLLRAPLEVGATFLGEGGRRARVDAIDATARSGLGELHGCVRIVERGGELDVEVTTVYCPDVGPAFIGSTMTSAVTGQRAEVRAELIGMTHATEP